MSQIRTHLGPILIFSWVLRALRLALELDPNFAFSYAFLALVYALKGMFAESLAICEKVATLSWVKSYSKALHSLILAIAGKTDEAKAILKELKERPKLDYHVALTPLPDT